MVNILNPYLEAISIKYIIAIGNNIPCLFLKPPPPSHPLPPHTNNCPSGPDLEFGTNFHTRFVQNKKIAQFMLQILSTLCVFFIYGTQKNKRVVPIFVKLTVRHGIDDSAHKHALVQKTD